MFRALSGHLAAAGVEPQNLFLFHPADLVAILELAWDRRDDNPLAELGEPDHRSDLNRFVDSWFGRRALSAQPPTPPVRPRPLQPDLTPVITGILRSSPSVWNHAIYAYMILNTRIEPILRRVVHELTHGERLGVASRETQHWIRNYEALLCDRPAPLSVSALNSCDRPDKEAINRNLFYRLLGMDLNHGGADNKPYLYTRPEAANKEFVSTLEELLREVWIGMINASNSNGPKATDDAKLSNLIKQLHDMLMTRRLNGTLSREEFDAVCRAEYCHLTVQTDKSPVVVDLRAQAASPEQRLYKIAQQVGAPAHGLAGSYFQIADPISELLLMIEDGIFTTVQGAVTALYTPGKEEEQLMRTIITHWSIITGRDIKGGKVAPIEGLRAPTTPAARVAEAAPAAPVTQSILTAARNGSS